MADDVTLNGTTVPLGPKIKTDEIAGVHWQQVKMAFGVDGVATPVSTADPLPVNIVGDITVDTTGLATDAKQNEQTGLLIQLRDLLNSPLPLMDGAATDAALKEVKDSILVIQDQTEGLALDATVVGISAKLPDTLGSKVSDSSLAVVIASDQPPINFSASSLPLPTDAATEEKQDVGNTSLAAILSKIIAAPATESKQDTANTSLTSIKTNTDKIPAVGQALASASVPVVLPALQITALTPPAAITGFATESTLVAQSAKLPATLGTKTVANSLAVNIASDQTVPMSAVSLPLPTNAATQATLEAVRLLLAATLTNDMTDRAARLLGVLSAGSNIIGKVGIDQTTPGTTNKVSLGTDTVTTKEIRSSSSSVTSPAVTTASSTALASNTNRVWASFWNEGSATVYIKFGATASITSYTLQLQSGQGYELTNGYTGIIDVITSSGTATLRATELT